MNRLTRLLTVVEDISLRGERSDLRERLYRGICAVSAFSVFVLVLPLNAAQDLPLAVNLAALTMGLLALGLYLAARRGHVYPSVLIAAVVVLVNAAWFPNAGSHGSVPYFVFVVLGLPLAFYTGWTQVLVSAGVIANVVVLMLVEARVPGLVHPYPDDWSRYLDLTGGFVVSAVMYGMVLWVVIAGYRGERRRLQEAQHSAAESRARLATLIDGTDDLLWMVEPRTFALTLFNQPCAAFVKGVLGVDLRPGLALEDAMPPEPAAQWRGFYRRALAEGTFSVEHPDPAGRHVLLCTVSPVRTGDAAIGVSVFAKDITDRKRAEEAEERRAQQALESQKLESLGRLAGGVAHDFNNMLGGIMGYADLLLADEPVPERREFLTAILDAAQRSADLTKKLLAFGRRGKNVVEAVDLNGMVRDCVTMLRPAFAGGVTIVPALGATWTVDGDPAQLNQAIVNLCLNASEAMPTGGTLALETADVSIAGESGEPRVAPGDYVRLRVRDTGVGMSEDVRAQIFEPFFSTKSRASAGGTGLGLPTVYGIVRLHHGTITVESAPAQGSTFTIWLPRGRAAAPATAEVRTEAPGRGTILVVEDEEALRRFTRMALERLGYRVLTAADGEEGVRVFADNRAELTGVLLDLKMPRMGGREAFVAMQAIDASVPVLVCSGYGDNEEAQGLISQGARGLLAKPFRLADLAQQLSKLV